MPKKKKPTKRFLLQLVVFIVFVSLISIKFYANYSQDRWDYMQLIYKSEGDIHEFSIENPIRNKDFPDSQKLILSLKQGGTFEGNFAIKNHQDAANFIIEYDPVVVVNDDGTEVEYDVFEDKSFKNVFLETDEFIFYDYKVVVPEDLPEGDYVTSLRFYSSSQRDEKDIDATYVKIIYAVGIELNLNVSDEPIDYEYDYVIANYDEMALQSLIVDIKNMGMVFFAALALFFLFKYFKVEYNT